MLHRLARRIHFKVAVVGGGCGGINITGHLNKRKVQNVGIFEPSNIHTYQPGQTMVGGNILLEAEIHRPMEKLIDKRNTWVRHPVTKVIPEKNTIIANDQEYTYDQLVLTSGVVLDYAKIPGSKEALEDPDSGVSTIYKAEYATKWNNIVKGIKKANPKVLFTEPPPPIKCAGAPQKIIHLTFDRLKHLYPSFKYVKAGAAIFGVPKYSAILESHLRAKKIEYVLSSNLVEIRAKERKAVFQQKDGLLEESYDYLHFVPPQHAHKYILESSLDDGSGFVDIDKETMQSTRFKNVWALGDCSNAPNSKTAAAIMSQGPLLAYNLLDAMAGREPSHRYDGYASCPIFVGNGKLMLAEFLYGGKVDETFGRFLDQGKANVPFYYMKTTMFPWVYWHLMPKGHWMGRKGIAL